MMGLRESRGDLASQAKAAKGGSCNPTLAREDYVLHPPIETEDQTICYILPIRAA